MLKVKEIAQISGLSIKSIYNLCNSGKLKHYRLSGTASIRIDPQDFKNYIDSCRIEANNEIHPN